MLIDTDITHGTYYGTHIQALIADDDDNKSGKVCARQYFIAL